MKGKIFNAQEVQAIIAGSKVMFREVIKVQPPKGLPSDCVIFQPYKDHQHIWTIQSCGIGVKEYERRTPFSKADKIEYWRELAPYKVGQKIFCKESFFANKNHNNLASKDLPVDSLIMYAAGGGANVYGKKRPAQHMKQEHSRLTLLIKEIKVERLASISCADYFAETGRRPINHMDLDCDTPDPRNNFAAYWNATHKKPEEKFEANPFVWSILFEVVK